QDDHYSPAIRDAIAYLKAHYREKISLSMVAQAVNFNAEYFSRLFVRETGMNFTVYLNSLRMRQAVELLEHTDKKVYEIAEEVGYSSLSYFSTAFKKSF
ncbi:helix-turn-helix transcriptional regulator, partial [Gemmiger formicilis]|uniref:helix-turn-helix transcriptional regulator n=1 Tax=Gemmiger formicilis TaxID=745368 RepID=UPI0019571D80